MATEGHPLDKRNEPAPQPDLDAQHKKRSPGDKMLDEAIEETFPASDPPAPTLPTVGPGANSPGKP